MKGILKTVAKKRKLDWINPDIYNFEKHTELNYVKYKLFPLRDTNYRDALEKMKEAGVRPASLRELIYWDGWDRENQIVALGTLVHNAEGAFVPNYCVHSVCTRRDSWIRRAFLGEYLCYSVKRLALLSINLNWNGLMTFLVIEN